MSWRARSRLRAVDAAQRFSVRSFDDGVVVFDRLSGDTHALDPTHSQVFAGSHEGLDDRMLGERLLARHPQLDAAQLREMLARVRDELALLGLLDSATGSP